MCLVFQKELARSITLEQGKTLADAEGDVFRGLRKSHVHWLFQRAIFREALLAC